MFNRKVIHTDEHGFPGPGRPDPLPPNSSVDAWIGHERAWHRYEDRVQDAFNREFAIHFRRALRREE